MGRTRGRWFRCFSEVPGVGYPGDPQRRARLRDHDAIPRVTEHLFDGERITSLTWASNDGSTSSSPVHRLAFAEAKNESSLKARERVLSALELPGEIMDYHFAMQGVIETLYKRRREEPANLAFVEWLAWFDARLVELNESEFRISPTSDEYLRVIWIDLLIDLHVRESYLHEGLALAERFARFQARADRVGELKERVARLRAEHE
jgi:hypothetical protein